MVISPRQDVGVNTGKLCMVMESVCCAYMYVCVCDISF